MILLKMAKQRLSRPAAFGSFLVALLVAVCLSSARADSVTVRSGGNGELSISTPWGDYAVYDEGGGIYWVGTQREFDRSRVIAIARSNGSRVSTVNEDGTDVTFVPSETYRVFVGDAALDNIDPTIMFTVPKKASASTHPFQQSLRCDKLD